MRNDRSHQGTAIQQTALILEAQSKCDVQGIHRQIGFPVEASLNVIRRPDPNATFKIRLWKLRHKSAHHGCDSGCVDTSEAFGSNGSPVEHVIAEINNKELVLRADESAETWEARAPGTLEL